MTCHEYDPDSDHSVREIFERADAKMYEDKKLLKSLGAVIRDGESAPSDQDNPIINIRKHILIAEPKMSTKVALHSFIGEQ